MNAQDIVDRIRARTAERKASPTRHDEGSILPHRVEVHILNFADEMTLLNPDCSTIREGIHPEIVEWLNTEIGEDDAWVFNEVNRGEDAFAGFGFEFRDSADAVKFKLRWAELFA